MTLFSRTDCQVNTITAHSGKAGYQKTYDEKKPASSKTYTTEGGFKVRTSM